MQFRRYLQRRLGQIPTGVSIIFIPALTNEWSKGCSPADHWRFYWPPVKDELMDIIENQDYSIATPKNEKSSKTYWGLKKVITLEINLMEITSENLKEKIFDNFDRLRKME